jgi:hypothetical protein
MSVNGPVWQYFGISPALGLSGGHAQCTCINPRFAVDSWGRVFVPNALEFEIKVLDANGNLMHRFGEYGNSDDVQSGETIRYGWPMYVQRAGNHVYVSDPQTMRVSRSILTYQKLSTANGSTGVDGHVYNMDLPSLSVSPNPFNPATRVTVKGVKGNVALKVFGVDGAVVADLSKLVIGKKTVMWNAAGLPSGLYFIELKTAHRTIRQKAILVR